MDLPTAADSKIGVEEAKESVSADEKGSVIEPITLDDSESEGEIREMDGDDDNGGEGDDDWDNSGSVNTDQDGMCTN